jgi:hypothetical protein
MTVEGVALIPRCTECEAAWLRADEERWRALLGGDDLNEPPELAFYCRSARSGSSAATKPVERYSAVGRRPQGLGDQFRMRISAGGSILSAG